MKKAYAFILLLYTSFSAVAEIDPLYLRAESFYKIHRYDSAVIYFTQVIRKYPEKKEGYYNRGLSFFKLSYFNSAAKDFEKCVLIDSSFTDAKYMKAISLQNQGKLRNAIHELEQVKAQNRDYDEVDKRIKNSRFAVYLSETWYYMVAIILLFIVLIAIVSRLAFFRRW